MTDTDDDTPQLSSTTLAALQSFLSDRKEQTKRFELLKANNIEGKSCDEDQQDENHLEIASMDLFPEDWQLSQFWYDEETSDTLAREAISETTGLIICLCSPTVFVKLKKLNPPNPLLLLEFDTRFDIYGREYHRYDYNHPLLLPPELNSAAGFIIADPPFLSEECLRKTAESIRFLAGDMGKVLLNTGKWILKMTKSNNNVSWHV